MRVATFNVENLDETNKEPTLEKRIEILRPQLARIDADILCLQEVHGQEREGEPRQLHALNLLLERTKYGGWNMAYTKTSKKEAYDKRNLVIVSRYDILDVRQVRNELVDDIVYRRITANPHEPDPKEVSWERPILCVTIAHPLGNIHVLNVHLKSRLPTVVPGQYDREKFAYVSVGGWAEGYFISSMKRVGQALEMRMLIDELLDVDRHAKIIVCGDFNSEPGEVPVEAIVGRVENTGNPELGYRQMIPCSLSLPSEIRFTHIHEGHGNLLDHIMISKAMLPYYQSSEIHNELIHDESIAFATDKKFPEADHAPFIVNFRMD